MPATLGINLKMTMATAETRSNVANFYKGISTNSVNLSTPISIPGSGEKEIELSDNGFLAIIPETHGIENEILDVTLYDDNQGTEFTYQNVGFLIISCFNITRSLIKNTSDEEVELSIVY